MDFLSHPFRSDSLQSTQSEAHSLLEQLFPVIVYGGSGSGKTSWATALAKEKGNYLIIEASNAPKSVRDWREIFSDENYVAFVFENIDRWSDLTQNSLAQLLKNNFKLDKYLISTSRRELVHEVKAARFRSDLYYRLSVRPLFLPKISDCRDDIENAATFWIDVHSLVAGVCCPILTQEALKKLQSSSWKGEWSEFVAVLERAVSYGHKTIKPDDLVFVPLPREESHLHAGLTLAEMEKKLIMQTLKLTASNKSQAARILGISIRTLRNKLNEYKQEEIHEFV